MRPVLTSLLMAVFLLFFLSCSSIQEPDPQMMAPQEFSYPVSITQNGFSAEAVLTRTGNGTYALQYVAPDTIYGLTYTWMTGEQICGFGMLEETSATRSKSLFGQLVDALETYLSSEASYETCEVGANEVRYVHKEFTISASSENGRILVIRFPQSDLLVQMKAETT